jgi:hypothetical protein
MMKVREELDFNEIIFSSVVHDEVVDDAFGEPVIVHYRYCTASRSSSGVRAHEKIKERQDAVMKVISEMAYPSRNDVVDQVTGSKADILFDIKQLIKEGKLVELPLPESEKSKGRSKYLSGSA